MKKIINPIAFFNDKKLLVFNIIVFLVGTITSVYMRGWFDHTFHLSFRTEINFYKTIVENTFCSFLLTLFVFFAGKIINKKTRFLDALNLAFYARIPFYIMALTNFNGQFSKLTAQMVSKNSITVNLPSTTSEYVFLIATSFISLLVVIFQIVTLYKGFKTISNAKKTTDYLLFIVFLIVSMFISTIILKNI